MPSTNAVAICGDEEPRCKRTGYSQHILAHKRYLVHHTTGRNDFKFDSAPGWLQRVVPPTRANELPVIDHHACGIRVDGGAS